MNHAITIHTLNHQQIAEIVSDGILLNTAQDGLDL